MGVTPDKNVGKRIGIYNVLDVCEHRTKYGHKLYHVECVFCGWESDMKLYDVKCPKKCTHTDIHGGHRSNFNKLVWDNQRIKTIFKGMMQRCYNPNDKDWDRYGGRGISICADWVENPQEFETWAIENGYADNLTIDRIDDSKGYCPDNCRWVTLEDNARYKSTTSLINVDGEIHTGREWSTLLGLSINIINGYVRTYGMDNTVEFIRRRKTDPSRRLKGGQSYYGEYMNNNTILTLQNVENVVQCIHSMETVQN